MDLSGQAAHRRAVSPASGPAGASLDDLLQAATGDTFAWCKGKLLLDAPADLDIIPCHTLLDPKVFHGLAERYALKYPGADRRAVVSMWTLYYFATLTIAPSIHWFATRRVLPFDLGDVSVAVDPQTAEPRAFVLPDAGEVRPDETVHGAMHGMIRGHAAPLIAALSAMTGVSAKLLWTNVVAYLGWIIDEIGRQTEPGMSAAGAALIDDPVWPDGWKNPLRGRVVPLAAGSDLRICKRRVCCLRYALPGVPGCGRACPLPLDRI